MRKISTMLELKVSWDYIGIGVKNSDFSECSILSRTKFQQPDQLWKLITAKPLIVSRSASNSWKEEKVFYNSCIQIMVRFFIEQLQNFIFLLPLIVKPDLPSVPKKFIECFADIFEDDHFPWCFCSKRCWGSYLCEDHIEFHSFDSPWMFLCSLDPSSGRLSCFSSSVTPLCRILLRWVHPCLIVGMKIFFTW
jgi:hypothetical protein